MARGKGEQRQSARQRLGAERQALALAGGVRFAPQLERSDGQVFIWLPELELYGSGADYDSARADLLEEVRDYCQRWASDPALQAAPNRRGHRALVIAALRAEQQGVLGELLFAGPPEESGSA